MYPINVADRPPDAGGALAKILPKSCPIGVSNRPVRQGPAAAWWYGGGWGESVGGELDEDYADLS